MKIFKLILIPVLLVGAILFLGFASYPNPTDGSPNFFITPGNILLYAVLPYVIGLLILALLILISYKDKLLRAVALGFLCFGLVVFVCYTPVLHTNVGEFFDLWLNIPTCIIFAGLIAFYSYKIHQSKKIAKNSN